MAVNATCQRQEGMWGGANESGLAPDGECIQAAGAGLRGARCASQAGEVVRALVPAAPHLPYLAPHFVPRCWQVTRRLRLQVQACEAVRAPIPAAPRLSDLTAHLMSHFQVTRRLRLQVQACEELEALRRQARRLGRQFLQPLSRVAGLHPLGDKQDWEYVPEVRGVERGAVGWGAVPEVRGVGRGIGRGARSRTGREYVPEARGVGKEGGVGDKQDWEYVFEVRGVGRGAVAQAGQEVHANQQDSNTWTHGTAGSTILLLYLSSCLLVSLSTKPTLLTVCRCRSLPLIACLRLRRYGATGSACRRRWSG